MAVKFSGNLTFTFLEYPNFVDRYRAAKNAGYMGVESSCPVDIPVEEVAKARRDADIQQVHINSYGGNIRGLAAIPNREKEFKQSLEISIKYAKALECPRMHVMAGLLQSEADRTDEELMAQWEATYVKNMKYTAQRLEECGITALVEPITTIPGYFVTHTQQAIDLIKKVDHGNFQLQLDLFHHQRTNGNLTQTLTDVMPYLGYIQVSQVPFRDEPDSGGEINYPFIFQQISKLGYTGWIGAEYSPRGRTEDGLGWLKPFLVD